MGKYRATVSFDACQSVDVEADSPAAAVEEAMLNASVRLCHQCSHELDLGDAINVVYVEDLETGDTHDDLDPSPVEAGLLRQVAELTALLQEFADFLEPMRFGRPSDDLKAAELDKKARAVLGQSEEPQA